MSSVRSAVARQAAEEYDAVVALETAGQGSKRVAIDPNDDVNESGMLHIERITAAADRLAELASNEQLRGWREKKKPTYKKSIKKGTESLKAAEAWISFVRQALQGKVVPDLGQSIRLNQVIAQMRGQVILKTSRLEASRRQLSERVVKLKDIENTLDSLSWIARMDSNLARQRQRQI